MRCELSQYSLAINIYLDLFTNALLQDNFTVTSEFIGKITELSSHHIT